MSSAPAATECRPIDRTDQSSALAALSSLIVPPPTYLVPPFRCAWGLHGRSIGDAVPSTFSVHNFTASAVATLWDSAHSAYDMSGRQGFFPITFSQKDTKDAVVTTPGWMGRTVWARFEGVPQWIRNSNVGKTSGRPVIGCQNFTALLSRAALLTPIPCEPTHLLRPRGSVSVQATNQSACDLQGLGAAAAELKVVCANQNGLRVPEPSADRPDSQNVGSAERRRIEFE